VLSSVLADSISTKCQAFSLTVSQFNLHH